MNKKTFPKNAYNDKTKKQSINKRKAKNSDSRTDT